jgi:hypothetical protein
MPPIKTQIRTAIEDSIKAITIANGFNLENYSNNRDLSLATFPNFYVRMINEVNLDFDNGQTNFQSYDNVVETEIVIWTKNSSSGYDPQRIGEDQLDLAEDDLKKLFGDSGQQGSPLASVGADMFYYMGSETSYFESNDIFTPDKRILKFRLQYTQDRLNPEEIAC